MARTVAPILSAMQPGIRPLAPMDGRTSSLPVGIVPSSGHPGTGGQSAKIPFHTDREPQSRSGQANVEGVLGIAYMTAGKPRCYVRESSAVDPTSHYGVEWEITPPTQPTILGPQVPPSNVYGGSRSNQLRQCRSSVAPIDRSRTSPNGKRYAKIPEVNHVERDDRKSDRVQSTSA